jgi:hypothetical protein
MIARGHRRGDRRGQRGAAGLVVLAGATALSAPLCLGLGRLGSAAHLRARTDAAADLVALAAVTGGDGAAGRVAAGNGVTLVALEVRPDGGVTVEVAAGGTSARAAAAPA